VSFPPIQSHIDRLAAARLAVAPKVPAIPLDDTDAGKVWHQSGAILKNVEVTDAEVLENWSRCSDLNRGPADYESAALPLSYTGAGDSR
jgi:hypothetical protein